MSTRLVRAALVLAALGLLASPASAARRITVFAHVPYPGNPGGLAVDGQTLWVTTSAANFDRPFDGSSSVFAYSLASGRLLPRKPNPIVVPKQPVAAMGLAGIALDAAGRQYIADMNGQVLRVDPRTAKSQVYATVPTSTSTSFTDMPTFDAFGPDGSLYVGDAGGEPVIWRVRRGGSGAPAMPGRPGGGAGHLARAARWRPGAAVVRRSAPGRQLRLDGRRP